MKIYRLVIGICIVLFSAIMVGYILYHYNEQGSISDGTLIWEEMYVADDNLYQG